MIYPLKTPSWAINSNDELFFIRIVARTEKLLISHCCLHLFSKN